VEKKARTSGSAPERRAVGELDFPTTSATVLPPRPPCNEHLHENGGSDRMVSP
jgi:hypothetical protein